MEGLRIGTIGISIRISEGSMALKSATDRLQVLENDVLLYQGDNAMMSIRNLLALKPRFELTIG
jgi:hypothetical protein